MKPSTVSSHAQRREQLPADWQRRGGARLQDGDTATFVSGLGTAACYGYARRLV